MPARADYERYFFFGSSVRIARYSRNVRVRGEATGRRRCLWYALIEALKKALPTKKYILDIKTPLLIEHRERRVIQEEGSRSQRYLDTIVGLSEESVKTWIPDCSRKPVVYPLGIDVSLFRESQIRPRQQRGSESNRTVQRS